LALAGCFPISAATAPAFPETLAGDDLTYDPSGNPTVTGSANSWPFLFDGSEHEFLDPANLYHKGAGNFYDPQIARSLSEAGETGTSGPGGGPAGNAIAPPSGGGGNGSFGQWYVGQLNPFSTSQQLGNLPDIGITVNEVSYVIPLGIIAQIADELASFFDWLLGGSDSPPPTPRQLLHHRHPLYDCILGLPEGLATTEASAADPPTYSTVEGAVKAVAPLANALSSKTGNECGGAIVPSGNGYTYTGPNPYSDPCLNHVEYPGDSVATYHTHPATCKEGVPDQPSEYDKNLVDKADPSHRPLYYITPSGEIYLYPHGGPARPLGR
jgi:hypothetical protein